MAVAEFRFYEELNDFLAPGLRRKPFRYGCARRATVKNAVEALGVPHTEIELILVNGESVDFSYMVQDGDRISIYPQFEAFDVTPLLRIRRQPLRHTRFIADSHLGALAKYLRVLGFDTLYRNDYTDREVVEVAIAERRIVLSRDRALLMQKRITHGCYVRAIVPLQQLREILVRLDLFRSIDPFTRCLICNVPLRRLSQDETRQRVNETTIGCYDDFRSCLTCDRVYWPGSHFRAIRAMIEGALSTTDTH